MAGPSVLFLGAADESLGGGLAPPFGAGRGGVAILQNRDVHIRRWPKAFALARAAEDTP